MAESNEALDKITELARSVDQLKRQVAAITRSRTLKSEVVEDLLVGGGSLAKVFLVVDEGKTQSGIAISFNRAWSGSISAGGLSGKLKELQAMDLISPSETRVAGNVVYSVTDYARGLNIVKALNSGLRGAKTGARK